MDDRSFFDGLAPTWDDNEVLSTPGKVRDILDKIGLKTGDKVLDLGTGTGVLLPYIAERIGETGEITAVDYSIGMLERAIQKFEDLTPKPEFLNIDFETETIPGEYDVIILYCVYPHLHVPFETLKWLRRVNLREGGKIAIAFPCSPDFINNIHKERHSDSDVLPSASDLCRSLRKAGLDAGVCAEGKEEYIVLIGVGEPHSEQLGS